MTGYEAVKIGFLEVKEKKVNKPLLGTFKRQVSNPVKC